MSEFLIDPKEIGSRIRQLRKAQGKTQSYFADMIFISPSYLALIESGKRTPTIEVLAQISKEFDVSVDYIMFGKTSSQDDQNRKVFQRLEKDYPPDSVKTALRLAEYYLNLDEKAAPGLPD